MPAITIRRLSEEAHRALKVRAARNGRSTEAEIRHILEAAAAPSGRTKLGTLLSEIGQEARFTDAEWSDVEARLRRRTEAAEPPTFDP